MEQFFPVIQTSSLFRGIDETDIRSMLLCLSANVRDYARGSFIFRAGDSMFSVGMVVAGSVLLVRDDFWGNRSILTNLMPGQLFAEAYTYAGSELDLSIAAAENTSIMFLDMHRISSPCSKACVCHTMMINNLLRSISEQNLLFSKKLGYLSERTTREKLLSYLSDRSAAAGSESFSIPFNRQELADYLSVDRSAMSAELGRMREEGLLSFQKNQFQLNMKIN